MISFQPMTTPPMTQLHSLILRFLLLPALAVALPLSLHAASPLENAETALQTGDLVTAETLLTARRSPARATSAASARGGAPRRGPSTGAAGMH